MAAGASGSQSGRVSATQATTPAVASPASTPVAIHAARDDPAPVGGAELGMRVGERQRHGSRGPHARRLEAVEPLEQDEGFFAVRAALDGRGQQRSRRARIAAIERGRARVQQLIAFPLTLGDGAARAVDVRLGPRMAPIEEEHARPDADGELVLSDKVVIEPGEEEVFDARVALALGHFSRFGEVVGPQRVGHRKW